MKRLTRLLVLLGGMTLSGLALASSPFYGSPKPKTTEAAGYQNVVIYNHTYDVYTVSATYKCMGPGPCSDSTEFTLYPVNDMHNPPRSIITYPINPPDYQVCFDIVRADGMPTFSGCAASGRIDIDPGQLNKAATVKATTK